MVTVPTGFVTSGDPLRAGRVITSITAQIARLCDGRPASDTDVSSEDWSALREARREATLCPDCQDRMHPLDIQPELYGMGRHTTATCMPCRCWPPSIR